MEEMNDSISSAHSQNLLLTFTVPEDRRSSQYVVTEGGTTQRNLNRSSNLQVMDYTYLICMVLYLPPKKWYLTLALNIIAYI